MKKLSLFLSCYLFMIGLLSGQTTTDKIIGTDYKGRTIYEGLKGGQYYFNTNGNKTYLLKGTVAPNVNEESAVVPMKKVKKSEKKGFMPRGRVLNSEKYDNLEWAGIAKLENKMREDISLGGLQGTAFQLQAGSILLYKTTKGNFGKMQILSFGRVDTVSELYTRWITFDKNGAIVKSSELDEDVISSSVRSEEAKDLDGSAFPGWEFFWKVKNDLLFIKARKDAKFYLLKDDESVTVQEPSSPTVTQQIKAPAIITWQHLLSNNSTTNNASFDIKACVETAETIKEYILIQNGQKLSIPRGLVPRKANDCLNVFNQTVSLKTGENKFQLLAQTGKNEIKSDVFTVYYDKNTAVSSEKRIALVIGNADYTEGSRLKNPVNDANLMTQTLKNLGFKVMQFNNLNKAQFEKAIREFSGVLSDYNVALFYYAGHGVQVEGDNYLLPIDAKLQDKKDVRFEAVKVSFAVHEFENHPDNVNIVILDACRNNPFRSWARGSAEGFKPMNIGGTLVAFATAADATASDGTGTNGLYTEELAKQMLLNQPIEAVFRETRKAVLNRSSRTQNPQEWSQLTQSFYFKK
jgi:Caspase domain